MFVDRKLYRETISRIQSEKKRTFKEIEDNNKLVNNTLKLDRHEFLKFAKDVIFQNYPGICLESEKFYGKRPYESITIKAKKDSIGRSCPISIRQHSSNSIFFVLNPGTKSIVVKCFKCEGFKELDQNSKILDDIRDKLVISDKEHKKTKTVKYTNLENLDNVKITNFSHCVMTLGESEILQFYDLQCFTYVAAKLDKKCPVFSNWNKRTIEENEPINFKYNNIAIVCGETSGIFVLDLDVTENENCKSGLKYFQQLCSKHNYYYPQATTCVLTPSGGVHLYYKYTDEFSSNSVRMNCDDKSIGIDIRSNSGCVISPPSKYKRPDGSIGKYEFLCMKKPQICPTFLQDLTVIHD
jgi:hypothetical protein